jgi:arabinofuranosyltransferase
LALLAHTRRPRLLVPLLLAPALYECFRMGYFACTVPNTALAKSAAKANWPQGFKYLCDFGATYWLLPLLGVVALLVASSINRDRRRTTVVLLPAILGLVHALYIVRVGGDFMHGRLLLPATFAVLQCAGVAVVPLDRRHLVLLSSALAVVLWSGLCAAYFEVPYLGGDRDGIADERGFYALVAHSTHPLELSSYRGFHLYEDGERTLNAATSCARTRGCAPFLLLDTENAEDVFYTDGRARRIPAAASVAGGTEAVVARGQVGVFGYLAGPNVMVVDRFGLADWVASRLPLGPRGRPGHEKLLPNAWLVARYGAELPAEEPAVTAARRALHCGRLAELREGVSAPMTMSRFAQNFRVALWSSELSIPADPAAAARLFCR